MAAMSMGRVMVAGVGRNPAPRISRMDMICVSYKISCMICMCIQCVCVYV